LQFLLSAVLAISVFIGIVICKSLVAYFRQYYGNLTVG